MNRQTMDFPLAKDLDMVALDLDGTVMCPRGKAPVSERTRAAVRALQRRGLPVTFVTGRTEEYASTLALEFELKLPMVTYNGGRLFCTTESRLLYQATIDGDVAAELADWLDLSEDVVACYLAAPEGLHLVQNRCSGDPAHDDYLYGTPRRLVDSLSREILKSGKVSKMIVSTQRPLEQEIAERFGSVVQVVRTHPELVEILPPGVSKGEGIERLCRHLDLDPGRVLAVGDQENDISTFKVCGYSVAMGDAPEKVKQVADFVTGTFSEDGCAQALEQLLRER